jgi:hypothetical protein
MLHRRQEMKILLLIIATACAWSFVSCAYSAASTAPTGTRTLPRGQWGEFETVREFVTLRSLASSHSMTGLVPIDAPHSRGADGRHEKLILVPSGSMITITRIVTGKYIDPDWNLNQTRGIYGTLETNGRAFRNVRVGIIASKGAALAYDRQIVSPL